jgi:antitoxin (DNA-binding transcriptional repressor) of toxin-antitoxin stability system
MRSEKVDIDQAKDQLVHLMNIASEGGEVIIHRDDKPLARIVSATDEVAYASTPPASDEFSTKDDMLSWDADGWETIPPSGAHGKFSHL